MPLLARADADRLGLNLFLADERARDVLDGSGRCPGNVRFSRPRLAQCGENRVGSLIEREQEARHGRIGDRHRSAICNLVEKQRNHRAARGEHVAVAHADEARVGIQDVRRNEDALLERLRHAHDVDRLASLVGRDADDRFHRVAVLLDCPDDVHCTDAIGQERLLREILAGRHLL